MKTYKLYQDPWLHIKNDSVTTRYNSKVVVVVVKKQRVVNQATLLNI